MREYNNKMDLKAVEWEGVGFILVAQVKKKMAAAFEILINLGVQ